MINESSCLLCSVEERKSDGFETTEDLKQQTNKNIMKFHFESLYSNNLTVKAINYFHAGHWKARKLSELAMTPLKG